MVLWCQARALELDELAREICRRKRCALLYVGAAQLPVWASHRFLRTQCAPGQLFRITRGDDGEHRGNARYQAELTKKPEP